MRFIGTISHLSEPREEALLFSRFLTQQNIAHVLEERVCQDWQSDDYGKIETLVWIEEEEKVAEAKQWLDQFLNRSSNEDFKVEPIVPISSSLESNKEQPTQSISWGKQSMGWLTQTFILICVLLMALSIKLTPGKDLTSNQTGKTIFISPVNQLLLYDYPLAYELIHDYFDVSENKVDQAEKNFEEKNLIKKLQETTLWTGVFSLWGKSQEKLPYQLATTPQFEKIKKGELWRLFTPALLHADLLHLFFNMLWIIVLGKQIEQRLTPVRYIALLLIFALFSNTLQYLATGPNFMGASGILCGMLTFIWERKKIAPWEGYELSQSTYLFMMIFIVAIAVLQLFAFFVGYALDLSFSLGIANTAHLSGALLGYLVGKINFFSWRKS